MPLRDWSSTGRWRYIRREPVFIYRVLSATPGTARGAGVGHRCSRHADDIDEQRTSSSIGWRSTFENARVVGEIIAGKLGVAKFYDQVRYVVAAKNRERGIRIVLKEAVLSMTPQRNEPAGLHMPGHARGTVSEAYGHGVHSAQDKLSLVETHILRILHEEDIHFFRLLAARGPRNQRVRAGKIGRAHV